MFVLAVCLPVFMSHGLQQVIYHHWMSGYIYTIITLTQFTIRLGTVQMKVVFFSIITQSVFSLSIRGTRRLIRSRQSDFVIQCDCNFLQIIFFIFGYFLPLILIIILYSVMIFKLLKQVINLQCLQQIFNFTKVVNKTSIPVIS